MIPAGLQVYSDQLASISEPLMNYCDQVSLPLLTNAMRSFETVTRAFIVEVLKQKPALDQFDAWNSKCMSRQCDACSCAWLFQK
jgi:hypothetical protein